ncbi:hypothetical protein D3C76_641700 [compost metagenome]
MLEVEVAVAPGLVTRIHVGAERCAGLFGHAVPVDAVFFVAIVWRQVKAAAEPPYGLFTFLFGDEEANVGVGSGHMRVVRVYNQRHAQGFEATACQFGAVGTGRRRQAATKHMGEVDPAFFDHVALTDNPRAAPATGFAHPGVLDEAGAAVFGFEGRADAVLQVEQVGFHGLGAASHRVTRKERGKFAT